MSIYTYSSVENDNMVISGPIWQANHDHGNRWIIGQVDFDGENQEIKNIIFEGKIGKTFKGFFAFHLRNTH